MSNVKPLPAPNPLTVYPVDTLVSEQWILEGLSHRFGERDAWGVAADWYEQCSPPGTVFVPIQFCVFRHSLGGVFGRLDQALAAGLKMIEDEPDRHHAVTILRFVLGEVAPLNNPTANRSYRREDELVHLSWLGGLHTENRWRKTEALTGWPMDDERGRPGRVICEVAKTFDTNRPKTSTA